MNEPITDPLIEQIAAELRRPVRLDPRFDERVMAALDAPEVIPLHPVPSPRRPWFVRPLTVRVSPVAMMAAAAALVGVVAIGVWQVQPVREVQVATIPIESGELVPVANGTGALLVMQQFTFYQKGLTSVALVGSLNDWGAETPTALTEVSEGLWTVSVPLLPGVYEYQFLLDGERRVTDPNAPQVPSDFGLPNSVVTVSPKR
jgi:hypothetical protein